MEEHFHYNHNGEENISRLIHLTQLGDGWCDGNSSGNSQHQGRDKEVIPIKHDLNERLKGSGDVLHQKFVLVSSTKFALFYDNREKDIQALSSPSALQNYFATQESSSRDINFRNLSLLLTIVYGEIQKKCTKLVPVKTNWRQHLSEVLILVCALLRARVL